MGQNLGVPMVEIEASISILRDNVLDLDNTFAHVIDATADAVGRNIELQLVSVEKDQSKSLSFLFLRNLVRILFGLTMI